MPRSPASTDFDGWVARLARPGTSREARVHLRTAGPPAVPAIRRGMHHPDASVRRACARILDNLLDDASVPDLVAALDDDDIGVRTRALHTLACDRCKDGECRPGEDLFVPKALEFVRSHPDPDLRAAAIDALANVGDRRPDVVAAIAEAAERDRSAAVRNMARIRLRRLGRSAVAG